MENLRFWTNFEIWDDWIRVQIPKKAAEKKEPHLLRLSAGLMQHSRFLHALHSKPSTGPATWKNVYSYPIQRPYWPVGSHMKRVIDLNLLKLGWEAMC